MSIRKAIDARAVGLMVLLCLVWGFHQVSIKAAAPDIPPILQLALRSGVATLLVGLLMFCRGERISLREGTWRPGLLTGLLFSLEFLFIGEGLRHTNASHMVVFLYTAPIFAALGLHAKLPTERLHAVQWVGILIAFAGIVTAFSGRGPHMAGVPTNPLLGDFFALLAGLSWGATTVVIRSSPLSSAPPSETLFYQLAASFVLLTLAAIATGQTRFHPTALAWESLLFQTLVVSFASFLLWFWLLREYLASRLGVLSFMTPLFGVGFGAWLLKEPLEANFLAGSALVLSGLVLVSGQEWLRQALANRNPAE